MSRTTITPTDVHHDGHTTDPTGTTITSGAGNGAQISAPSSAGHTLVRASNGGDTDATLVVLAGTGQAGCTHDDMPIAIPAGTTAWVGPLSSANYGQHGSIVIETDTALDLTALHITRH